MKMDRIGEPKNFTVRRVLEKRGGVHPCPNVKASGGKAAGGIGASLR